MGKTSPLLTELGSFAKYCHQSIDSTVLVHLDGVAMTLLNYELIGEEADSLGMPIPGTLINKASDEKYCFEGISIVCERVIKS